MKDVHTSHTWSFGSFVCLRRFPQSLLGNSQHITEPVARDATNTEWVVPGPAASSTEAPLNADSSSGLGIDRPAA